MKNSLELLENAIEIHIRMEYYLQNAWESFFLIPKLSEIDPEAMIKIFGVSEVEKAKSSICGGS